MKVDLKRNIRKRKKERFELALSKKKEQEYINKIKGEGWTLEQIEEQTELICLEAVKQNGRALRLVENQTEQICWEAAKEDGWSLEYVKNQTAKVGLEAVKESGWALEYVNMKTEEMKLASLFDDFQSCDSDELEDFYEFIDTPTSEMALIYGLLEQWGYQLPSYRFIRSQLVNQEICLNDSPYHVLDCLYYD